MSTIDKGNAYRRKVVKMLEAAGAHVIVRGIGFAGDDLKVKVADVELSAEVKDHRRYDFAGWMAQAADNAEGAIPVVFAHRNGRSAAEDGYVVMSGAAFVRLLTRDVNVEEIDLVGVNVSVNDVSRGEER